MAGSSSSLKHVGSRQVKSLLSFTVQSTEERQFLKRGSGSAKQGRERQKQGKSVSIVVADWKKGGIQTDIHREKAGREVEAEEGGSRDRAGRGVDRQEEPSSCFCLQNHPSHRAYEACMATHEVPCSRNA